MFSTIVCREWVTFATNTSAVIDIASDLCISLLWVPSRVMKGHKRELRWPITRRAAAAKCGNITSQALGYIE